MESLITLVAGLGGAIIGAAASIVTMIFQAKAQSNVERTRMAVDLAIAEHEVDVRTMEDGTGPKEVPPLPVYVSYNKKIIDKLVDGTLTDQTLSQIRTDRKNQLEWFRVTKL